MHFLRTALMAIFAFSTLLFGCKNEAQKAENRWEQKTEHFTTGEVSAKYWLKNGQKDSTYESFGPKGAKTGELFFRNGKQEGRGFTFYPSGKIKEEYFVKNGLREGRSTVFFENGTKQMETDHLGGKLHGSMRRWNAEGQLLVESIFEADTLKKAIFQAKK